MSDFDLLVRVSRLYFELGETQERVAEMLGVTRPQVSRLLKEARERGVVEIRIVDRSGEDDRVASRLRDRFGLRHVEVVARLAGPEDLTRRLIGRAAAQIFRQAVRERMVVGVGGGASVGAVIDQLVETLGADPPRLITVVPLAGGAGPGSGANDPARRLAHATGGFAQEIPAPGMVDSQTTRDALLAHAAVQNIVRMWDGLDIALFGIGAGSWTDLWFGAEVVAALEREGAVGEVLIRPFDLNGIRCGARLDGQTIGLEPARLARVPMSIAVAGGETKIRPILGALRAGYVQMLVTDRETATGVLELDDATRHDERGEDHAASEMVGVAAAAAAAPSKEGW